MLTYQFELLFSVTIPNYRRTYLKSNAMRAKYYEKGNKKLPSQYCDKALLDGQGTREPDGVKYAWKSFPIIRKKVKRMTDFLIEVSTGERVVANPEYVGKPSIANINGQGIYNGTIMKYERNSMIGQIKDQLRMHFMNIVPIKRFPIVIEVEIYDVLIDEEYSNKQRWDVGNRFFPYQKAIEDTLTDCNALVDDDSKFVTGPPRPLFCPIVDTKDRKLVISVYKDNRDIVLNSPDYIRIHGQNLK